MGILERMAVRGTTWRPHRGPCSRPVLALAVIVALLAACSSDPSQGDPGPGERISAFIDAWQRMDFDTASDITTSPAAAAVMLEAVTGDLRPDQLSITPGEVSRNGSTQATATVTITWQLPDAGSWTYPATWTWKKDRDWELDWSPAVIHPKLGERQTLAARTTPAEPGLLVDRNNNQIVQPVTVYSVVLMPARTPDVAAAAAALAPLLSTVDPTVTADGIVAGRCAGPGGGGRGDPGSRFGGPQRRDPSPPIRPASATPSPTCGTRTTGDSSPNSTPSRG